LLFIYNHSNTIFIIVCRFVFVKYVHTEILWEMVQLKLRVVSDGWFGGFIYR